jgi:hypothetical protein
VLRVFPEIRNEQKVKLKWKSDSKRLIFTYLGFLERFCPGKCLYNKFWPLWSLPGQISHKINLLDCTLIGTKKLYFQIFDEKKSTIKKFIALIGIWCWLLPMKIKGV